MLLKGGSTLMDNVKLTKEQQDMIDIFVKALPQFRKELGISQTVLGRKIGLSRQMVSAIERSVYPMSWSVFLSNALFFKVNYNQDKKQLNDLDKFLMIETNGCKNKDKE